MFDWVLKRLFEPLRVSVTNWLSDGGALLSAAMAYYGALSLYPLLLILIAGLGWLSTVVPDLQLQQQQLLSVVEQNVSPWLAEQLATLLATVKSKAAVGGPIGIVTLVIAAIGVFLQVEEVFAHVWHDPKSSESGIWTAVRTALFDRLTAFLMLLAIGLFIIVTWIINLAIGGLITYFENWAGEGRGVRAQQFVISIALNALLFTIVYKVLPKARVLWRQAAIGGIFTAVVWQLGLRLLEMFVISKSYSAYGIVGSFLAIMLWMYYASAVFIVGAELVHYHCCRHLGTNSSARKYGRRRPIEPNPPTAVERDS